MNIKNTALIGLALPLLAGCGQVVGAFVPPQTVSNPGNLTGATLSTASAMRIQTVVGDIQYDTSAALPPQSFADIKYPDDVPFGIRPRAVSLKVAFSKAAVVGPCVAPDTFTVTLKTFSASLWNSGDKAGAATLSGAPNLTVKATRTGVGAGGTTYSLAANSVSVSANAATTDRAIDILTTGGQNDASASAQISADSDALAGCHLSFTLGDSSVTLSNFK
ncbi:hypothetical protein [Deinococcus koreensis]|uniref:Lipoprotein n=1 Tax=Deinococcus koreensis TaxID=2054903 RepID=A0A2K3UVZ4_9DEIO|nr:hypothetical protein [Deinococcus koreensis]PNY80707.1 hypothetical protein CVO96_04410 [Deinococcus koreensis]